jgi:hypothetical protein
MTETADAVVGPPCPKCRSCHTERLDFLAKTPQVFQCLYCRYFWFVKIDPRRLTRDAFVFSFLRRFAQRRKSAS